MKRQLTIYLLIAALVSLSLVQPVFAIFGIGDIVFDPSVYAQAVQQLIQLEQQYVGTSFSKISCGSGLPHS